MKRTFALLFVALFTTVLFTGCEEEQKTPKYFFLFIGDGMGLGQEQLTESYMGAYQSIYPDPQLYFTTLPQKGFITTYSKSHKITDSAAAGTALASGEKTDNGIIMENSDGTEEFSSVAQYAKAKGMEVGIISSVSLDHATPAVFYSHASSRNMYYEISMQLPDSDFDYFAGGGFRNPEGLDKSKAYSEKYTDQNSVGTAVEGKKNMLEYAAEMGYTIINNVEDFRALGADAEKIIAINESLQGGAAMPYTIDRKDGELSLADYVSKGIEVLENEKGFFMMVEGGKIDWACHANDAITTIHDVIDFDNAVGEAMKFYLNHPDETLIIVTGDHETGGLSMGNTLAGKSGNYKILDNQIASLEVIENKMNELQSPSYDTVMAYVEQYFGLGGDVELTDYDKKKLRDAYVYSYVSKEGVSDTESIDKYNYYEPVTTTATAILSQKAGIDWASYSHTAMPLPVHSIGAGSELFGGYYDNTDIPKKITALIGE